MSRIRALTVYYDEDIDETTVTKGPLFAMGDALLTADVLRDSVYDVSRLYDESVVTLTADMEAIRLAAKARQGER